MGKYEKIKELDLPHRAIAVYFYLWERADKEGKCWPAINTIAQEINLSRSTVKRAIGELKNADVIVTEQRYRSKGGKSSLLFLIK